MTLRDALAAADHRSASICIHVRGTSMPDQTPCEEYAARICADPAFREALVESVADGLRGYRHGRYGPEHGTREKKVESHEREFARAIVDRMLKDNQA